MTCLPFLKKIVLLLILWNVITVGIPFALSEEDGPIYIGVLLPPEWPGRTTSV